MICILFPPGGFGSTVEYCLRNFTKEFEKIEGHICEDGSMHFFRKEFHPINDREILNISISNKKIVTPIYINEDCNIEKSIDLVKNQLTKNDKVIFIVLENLFQAERNFFFMYNKIFLSPLLNYDIFQISKKYKKYKIWNPEYNSIDEMQIWEKREMLSMEHSIVSTHIITESDSTWLKINTDDLLYNFKNTIKNIIDFAGLNFDNAGFDDFSNKWFNKQQYILNKYKLINNIVDCVISGTNLTWEPMDLFYEAFIQYKLKQAGFELECSRLNVFPTDSITLKKHLYDIT